MLINRRHFIATSSVTIAAGVGVTASHLLKMASDELLAKQQGAVSIGLQK